MATWRQCSAKAVGVMLEHPPPACLAIIRLLDSFQTWVLAELLGVQTVRQDGDCEWLPYHQRLTRSW
ncbi:hypothetical protein ABBQ38_008706 [Trebouxia sp. C0009 RCD-2024]